LRCGTALIELTLLDEAKHRFKAVLAVEKDNAQARSGILKVEDARMLELLEELKTKANVLYKDGSYSTATTSYGKALKAVEKAKLHLKSSRTAKDALTVTLLNNRAACYMASEKSEAAVKDCQEALKVDENSVKSQLRLSKAYLRLGLFTEAADAADLVSEMEGAADKDIRIALLEKKKMKTLLEQWEKGVSNIEDEPSKP